MRFLRLLLIALALLPASFDAAAVVPYESAEATALKLVPGGTVVSGALGRGHGRQVWLFDVSVPGSRNVREIQVDARTGAVVSNTLEVPTDR